MSPPGRPKGEEQRSAQRGGFPMSPPGRPKGEEQRSAQREEAPLSVPCRRGRCARQAATKANPGVGRAEAPR
jgi:hypothetical protein